LPWFVSFLTTVAVLAMLPALAGLVVRRRWGTALSLFSAAVALVLVAGCPLSGHHHFGLWAEAVAAPAVNRSAAGRGRRRWRGAG